MMLNLLQRRFGVVMVIWVACLIAITLGVKVGVPELGIASAAASQPIAPVVSFLINVTWYLTLIAVIVGVSKKGDWPERIADWKRHAS